MAGVTEQDGETPVLFPPMPAPDDLTRSFWDGVEEGRLVIRRCDACGWYQHPPSILCKRCLSTSFTPTEVSGEATLVTWTQPMYAADPWFLTRVPYVLAVVDLVEQDPLRLVTNVVDCPEEHLRIDLPLRVTFPEVAPGCRLPLFAPAGG